MPTAPVPPTTATCGLRFIEHTSINQPLFHVNHMKAPPPSVSPCSVVLFRFPHIGSKLRLAPPLARVRWQTALAPGNTPSPSTHATASGHSRPAGFARGESRREGDSCSIVSRRFPSFRLTSADNSHAASSCSPFSSASIPPAPSNSPPSSAPPTPASPCASPSAPPAIPLQASPPPSSSPPPHPSIPAQSSLSSATAPDMPPTDSTPAPTPVAPAVSSPQTCPR